MIFFFRSIFDFVLYFNFVGGFVADIIACMSDFFYLKGYQRKLCFFEKKIHIVTVRCRAMVVYHNQPLLIGRGVVAIYICPLYV